MPYKIKLQILIIPLIIIPIVVVTLIFVSNTTSSIEKLQIEAMEFKVNTLKRNCKELDETLKLSNIDEIEYYIENSKKKVIEASSEIDVLGGNIFIIDTLQGKIVHHPEMTEQEMDDLAGAEFINDLIAYKTIEGNGGEYTDGYWVFDGIGRMSYERNGKNKVSVFAYFDKWYWMIVASADEEVVFKSINDSRTLAFFAMGISIAVAILILFFIARGISKPILRLKEASQKMGEGNLDHVVEIKSRDEFGMLGKFFNQMAKNLKESFKKIEAQKAEIQEYNLHLEDMVKQRTKQLEEAHKELKHAFEEVTDLKIQQDGDYFLTSLLIKPLIVNKTESNKVKADFFISQKKKFTFKNWKAELGGDICIAQSILLHSDVEGDKEYTVFVNGDAMGKSIQGAGGSIILGVVFNAFVNRTKYVQGSEEMSPEEWLMRCFEELQDVFVSFDGSMLISVVMGIIDDETGMMYYFNCEHPWTTLYRDGKASFIEHELLNRKIGTVEGMEKVRIRKTQLHHNDIIIAGSDGRDDILLEIDEKTGQRVINEDEFFFLNCVEKADGNLKETAELIKEKGELTDDLSLLKITYNKKGYNKADEIESSEFLDLKNRGFKAYQKQDYKQASELLNKAVQLHLDSECYSKLVNSYIKMGNFAKALYNVEKAIKHYPGNLTIVFQTALLNKKDKNYERAIYYGRRYYIHDPENIANLLNLADTYRMMRDYENANEVLAEAEKLEPDNENIKRLKRLIKNQSISEIN